VADLPGTFQDFDLVDDPRLDYSVAVELRLLLDKLLTAIIGCCVEGRCFTRQHSRLGEHTGVTVKHPSSTTTPDTALLAAVCCERRVSGRRMDDNARRFTLGQPLSPARGCAIRRFDVAGYDITLHAPGEGRARRLSLYTWRSGEAELVAD